MFTAVHRWLPLLVVLAGCSEKLPPTPAGLTAALETAEKALGDGKAIPASTISKELQAHAMRPAVPTDMKVWLVRLARETEAINSLTPAQSGPLPIELRSPHPLP